MAIYHQHFASGQKHPRPVLDGLPETIRALLAQPGTDQDQLREILRDIATTCLTKADGKHRSANLGAVLTALILMGDTEGGAVLITELTVSAPGELLQVYKELGRHADIRQLAPHFSANRRDALRFAQTLAATGPEPLELRHFVQAVADPL